MKDFTQRRRICLDLEMDNSDICYNIAVSDTSIDEFHNTSTRLFYIDEDAIRPCYVEYSISTYGNDTENFCGSDVSFYDDSLCNNQQLPPCV